MESWEIGGANCVMRKLVRGWLLAGGWEGTLSWGTFRFQKKCDMDDWECATRQEERLALKMYV